MLGRELTRGRGLAVGEGLVWDWDWGRAEVRMATRHLEGR